METTPTLEIIPNPMVVGLQVIPFLVTLFALYTILFKPMLAYLDARSAAIEGERQKAADLETRLSARMAEYDAKLAAARAEVAELRSKRRKEAEGEYNSKVAAARTAAESRIAHALEELGADRLQARTSLVQSAQGLGAQIAANVLGREAAGGLA